MRISRLVAVMLALATFGAAAPPLLAEPTAAAPATPAALTAPAMLADPGWLGGAGAFTGPEPVTTVVADGSNGPAVFAYDNFAPEFDGDGASGTWEFFTSATSAGTEFFTSATSAGTVDLDYTWSGFHSYFEVTATLEAFVINDDTETTVPLVNEGPADCPPCDAPSDGFIYTGTVSLTVPAGATYGFRMTGSNNDLNARLKGRIIVDGPSFGPAWDQVVINGFGGDRTIGDAGITEAGFATTRSYLDDGNNFGGSEPVVAVDLVIGDGVDEVTSASLLGTDIFVVGSVASSSYTIDELEILSQFVIDGGTLIATSNEAGDPVAQTFGLTQVDGVFNPSVLASDIHPVADGPFGNVGTFDTTAPAGYYSSLGPSAEVVAFDAEGGATIAEILPDVPDVGAGLSLFVADVDVFTEPNAGTNGTLIKNLFAYAATWVPGGDEEEGPSPEAVLLQAVAVNESQTAVVLRVSGPTDTTATALLFTANTCTDGELIDREFLSSVDVDLDANGEGFFAGVVDNDIYTEVGVFAAAAFSFGEGFSPLSRCIRVGATNDAWTRAETIPLTQVGDQAVGDATGYLDSPGNSRWYRFAVQPGAIATVELSNLPANYDLAMYTDIVQAFQDLTGDEDVDGLNRLSAEFAPAVFSPAVFSPAVFSPAVFSPAAYSPAVFSPAVFSPAVFSPAVFSPAVFSPAVFSPAVFSPAVFSPAVFSPAVFSPAVFSPAVFSPAVFSPENYASAQARSLTAVSALDGTANEIVVANTWNNTGFFYLRVTGRNGAFDAENPFRLDVTLDGTRCAEVVPIAPTGPVFAPAGGHETIILWDPDRMNGALEGNDPGAMAALEANLTALAERPEVDGAIVDLGQFPHLVALHDQADAFPNCPYAENLVAAAVKDVIAAYRSANPLRYVVLAGSDAQIPFFRYPDQALLGPEQNYDPPMADDTQSQSALRLNFILGQDEYGAGTILSLRDGPLPIPQLAVGRVGESASDMNVLLDAYLGTSAGVVDTPTSSLVTGYDFLTDSAEAVQAEFVAGTDNARNDTLITAADISPDDPRSWTADDLRRELLDEGEDLIFLAGHFSANSALAADYKTSMVTTELLASDVDLTNSIVFSGGCHSGYNIVDGEIVPGVTLPLDWTQAFARKGATLVAGTGYQYGDTDFLEYSERLYALFARELRRGQGAVSVGEALVRAKQEYLTTTPEMRALHYKSVVISTVFGLPMLSVDLPGERFDDPPAGGAVSPTSVPAGTPGAQLGLQSAQLPVDPDVTEQQVTLTNLEGGTLEASYLQGPDGVVTNPAEPAIPLITRDVTVPGLSLRGIGFRSGSWTESPVIPLTGAPTTELRGVHTPFVSTVNFPMRLARANYFGAIAGSGGTTLFITPAQHRVNQVGDITAIRRQLRNLVFQLFYSANTETYGQNRPALSGPPTFTNIRAVTDGDDVLFLARVMGDPAAGIQTVWVTYTDGAGTSGDWVSLDLEQDPNDSTLWTARLPGAAAPGAFGRLEYLIQAANGMGLVTLDDNLGAYYRVLGPIGEVADDGSPAVPRTATTVAVAPVPPVAYGDGVTVSATLQAAGQPVAGRAVLFALGGAGRVATTNSSGVATVNLPVTAVPGSYDLTASFSGNEELEPATGTREVTVAKAETELVLDLDPSVEVVGGFDTGLSALVRDATGTPLLQRTVYFTIESPTGTAVIPRITNNVGVAELGVVDLPAGTYAVLVQFLGQIAVPDGGSVEIVDPIYNPATATAELVLEVDDGEILSCMGVTGTQAQLEAQGYTVIIGTNRRTERLVGTDGNDFILGLGGNDTIVARAGDDVVCGGDGNDNIQLGAGDDRADGGDGRDTVNGDSGNDTIDGGNDNDRLFGRDGNDTMNGGAGVDLVDGSLGNDVLSGGLDNDVVRGGPGDDVVNGDEGNDILRGDAGRDTLDGGDDIDNCNGGGAADTGIRCEVVRGIP